jgi:hypothetical protein
MADSRYDKAFVRGLRERGFEEAGTSSWCAFPPRVDTIAFRS